MSKSAEEQKQSLGSLLESLEAVKKSRFYLAVALSGLASIIVWSVFIYFAVKFGKNGDFNLALLTGLIGTIIAAVILLKGLSAPVDISDKIGKLLGLDLHELSKELEGKFHEANKLHEISANVTAGLFLDDVLNRIYDSFKLHIPYNRMGCALLSDENKTLTAYWGRSDSPHVKIQTGYSASMQGSSLQKVIDTGRPRILNDLEAYLVEHPTSTATELLVTEGMRSSLTCPLVADGKPLGFLFFTSSEKNTYQNLHQEIFLQIAEQISILIEKGRKYQQLHELNQKLQAGYPYK
jgi:hypothetical protein